MREPDWQSDDGALAMYLGDCQEVLPLLPVSSVQLIATDPPYFKVKGEPWDRQWDKPEAFLAWLSDVVAQFHSVLANNGSLYCFASPRMAARVECLVAERFAVLNSLVWRKAASRAGQACKEELRGFFPATERIIFAEHKGADGMAKGESGWGAKCDELRGFVFEPLRSYLDDEWKRAGLSAGDANEATCTQMSGHYFTRSQWALPTEAQYKILQQRANRDGGEFLRKDYEFLRKDYEDLRKDYEDLRRPFCLTADVPYTDVWDFAVVPTHHNRHPCAKPEAMMAHIITASSRPGDLVLDAFAGSASTGVACHETGRRFIGIEKEPRYFDIAVRRLEAAVLAGRQGDLFQ